jgi:hypothetical protein
MTNLKPKVYYKNISSEEAELLKLRNDEHGFYSRSTKIQASVNKHIEVREGYSCIKGIIYKIYSPNTPKIYVGSSTTKTIKILVSQSRTIVRANPNLLEVAKHGGAEIKLLSDFPCKSRKELEQEKGRWIANLRNEGHQVTNKQGQNDGYSKDQLNERYYNNKAKNQAMFSCECCNKEFNKADLKRHKTTQKYINNISENSLKIH